MHRRFLSLSLLAFVAACSGAVGVGAGYEPPDPSSPPPRVPGSRPTPPSGDGVTPTPEPPPTGASKPGCTGVQAPRARLRRLTRDEYDNTVRVLLGDTTAPAQQFAKDERVGLFESNVIDPIAPLQAEQLHAAAERLAAKAVTNLGALLPCQNHDDACARQFISTFGARAFRRPLAASEVDAFVRLHAAGKAQGFTVGIQTVLEAMLQSPHFLYRVELGTPVASAPGVMALTPWELAARLSYFLLDAPPTDALVAAAQSGALLGTAELEKQALQLLKDPRAAQLLRRFHHQWLGIEELSHLEKDAAHYPEYSATLAQAMSTETDLFIASVFQTDGKLQTLLTSSASFVDATLQKLYAPPTKPATAAGKFVPVSLDPQQRRGILTHASVLATHAQADQSSPILRGKFVREHLLCVDLPPPPPDLDANTPPVSATVSTRARFEMHRNRPACAGCHQLIDPLGFGFESYDGIGKYRTTDAGKPVDARGELTATDVDGPFTGAVELAGRLAGSAMVQRCVSTQWLRFALGVKETNELACALEEVGTSFAASGFDLRQLIVGVVKSEAFRHHLQ